MAKHSRAAVAAMWVRQGGNPAKAREAVAVAECESGLDDAASSYCCHGVWQMHEMHTSLQCARSLACSTKKAVSMSKNGTDWSAWDCHPDSRGRTGPMPEVDERFFANLKTPLGEIPLPGPDLDFTNPLGPLNPINPLEGIPGIPGVGGGGSLADFLALPAFFKGLGELILTPQGWVRIGKLGGGALLIVWGLRVIVKQSTGTDPIGTAKKGVEAAAVVAATKKLPV